MKFDALSVDAVEESGPLTDAQAEINLRWLTEIISERPRMIIKDDREKAMEFWANLASKTLGFSSPSTSGFVLCTFANWSTVLYIKALQIQNGE